MVAYLATKTLYKSSLYALLMVIANENQNVTASTTNSVSADDAIERTAKYYEHRAFLECIEELGISEEQALAVKTLLESNGYVVEFSYSLRISESEREWSKQAKARLDAHNNLVVVSTPSSSWEVEEARKMYDEFTKCMDLINQIENLAPTIVDPIFRNQRLADRKANNDTLMTARVAKWNALPEQEEILKLPSGGKIILTRSKVEYKQSRKTQFYASLRIETADISDKSFYLSDFVTSSGKAQRKKFLQHYSTLSNQDAMCIAGNLVELSQRLSKERRFA